jgi:hypothetical protein
MEGFSIGIPQIAQGAANLRIPEFGKVYSLPLCATTLAFNSFRTTLKKSLCLFCKIVGVRVEKEARDCGTLIG